MRALVLGLAGLLVAAPASAQQHHPEHQAMAACQAGQPCPMHDMMSAEMKALQQFAPLRLLANAESLKLSKEQVAQLTVLRDAMGKAIDEANAAPMKPMNPAMHPSMNPPMNHGMCIQASTALMAKALLTESQREAATKN